MRSASSSFSVSTISTRSPSPGRSLENSKGGKPRSISLSRSPLVKDGARRSSPASMSISPSHRGRIPDYERKRRRDSSSSAGSYISDDARSSLRDSRDRVSSRSTRRKFKQLSPPVRGRMTESKSPHKDRRRLSNDRQRFEERERPVDSGPPQQILQENREIPRGRSLSPFSKRLALTQAMNMTR